MNAPGYWRHALTPAGTGMKFQRADALPRRRHSPVAFLVLAIAAEVARTQRIVCDDRTRPHTRPRPTASLRAALQKIMTDTPIPHVRVYTPVPYTATNRASRSFEVGSHVVRVTKINEGRWVASVDDTSCGASFESSADAWAAGVRMSQRIDRDEVP